jgi:hypothetical protein
MQPRVAATAELTSVERAADLRWTMTGDLDDLRDMAANIIELINTFQRQTDRALGVRAPVATRCKDALHGRDGSLDWGDPTCEELPVKAGLCTACYHREYRWRRSNDLGPRETVEAA